jgi:hypothetical protein
VAPPRCEDPLLVPYPDSEEARRALLFGLSRIYAIIAETESLAEHDGDVQFERP